MLGSFANCLKNEGNLNSQKIKANSHFNAPELSHQHAINLQIVDVYSLGVSLLCAFYLLEPLERKKYLLLNKYFENQYDILKVIEQMVLPYEERPNIFKIREGISKTSYKFENMGHLIESVRHKNRPVVLGLAKMKLLFSEGYERFGLWNEWKKEYEQAFHILEPTYDDYHKAEAFK